MKLTLIDKFGDWLLNLRIVELAQQRSMAMDKIQSLAKPLNDTLFKMFVMRNSAYRKQWEEEIHDLLDKISDTTFGKKRAKFEEDDYMLWLFLFYFEDNKNNPKPNMSHNLSNLLKKYPEESKTNWSIEEFKNFTELFHKHFCSKLESGTYRYEDLENYLEVHEN